MEILCNHIFSFDGLARLGVEPASRLRDERLTQRLPDVTVTILSSRWEPGTRTLVKFYNRANDSNSRVSKLSAQTYTV